MWWRALGAVLVLLCVGVAGGYAVADRSEEEPSPGGTPTPVTAVSPAVPTPDAPSYAPDPDYPPLTTTVLPTEPVKLRPDPEGAGVRVDIPVGWRSNRPASTDFWNFVPPGDDTQGTYVLRVNIDRGANHSIGAAMAGRIAALEETASQGHIEDFEVTAQTGDTFEASYVDNGHLRLTIERWVSFDGSNAYASVAVTGRQVDEAGLGPLLTRTVTSMRELPPKPQGGGNHQG
jgi:hypothetical protein